MYSYENKKGNIIKKFFLCLVVLVVGFLIWKLWWRNFGTSDNTGNYVVAERLSFSDGNNGLYKSNVDVIADITNCVVGISKLKDTGSTIFLENGITEMGIGSRNNCF